MLRRRAFWMAIVVVLLAIPAVALGAGGWNGQTAPNDPGYNSAERDPANHCINDEQWYLYSFIPSCTPLASDPESSAGMFVDQAWKQFTIGRPDVKIAYVEGGPNWHDQQFRQELVPRTYVNTGELPLPERADGSACSAYDCNGDGQVNALDYAQDPRLHRPYVNVDITPEDLIVAFGNCRVAHGRIVGRFPCARDRHYDNDHNGYANDISGWNFSRGNNDPATGDSAYGHSDNQMQRAAAEANNGVGDAGVCPGCMILPIKDGDEALDRTDRVAQSVYFAVDSGASVVVLLTAELGYSNLTKAALDYAWKKGVVVVGASNDFDSTDHQEGMFWPREWPGNGIVADGTGTIGATTHTDRLTHSFRERSNETSFGPHALFSAANGGGSTSESSPTQGAIAGLIASAGRDAADRRQIAGRLDAGEVKQVLRATASNIDDPTLGWPGKPGATFNVQYGYGRPNVLRAMQAVAANRIPPVPDILAPDWYGLYDPTTATSVPVLADIAAHRARNMSYVVQYGLGADPTEAEFHTIAHGSVAGTHVHGTLGTLDLRQIPPSLWQRALHHTTDLSSTEQYTVTLRVQTTDERGNMGEDRRAIEVFHDPTIRRGFPLKLGQGKDAQPVMADLQGRGRLDMIFGDANGTVHAIDPSGHELPGWPVHTNALALGIGATPAGHAGAVPPADEPVEAPAAAGDMNGDGALEVIVTSTTGRVYAFDRHGRIVRGFPKALGANVQGLSVPPPNLPYTRPPSMGADASPVLVHLPGSRSRLDILQAAWDGKLYAFDSAGGSVAGWPVTAQLPAASRPRAPYKDMHDYKLVSTPTLADLFGDGRREIVIKSQEFDYDTNTPLGGLGLGSRFYVMAFWPDGNRHAGGAMLPGWPVRIQGTLGYYGSAQDAITEGIDSASAADVNHNGRDEVIQGTVFGVPWQIDGSGSSKPIAPQPGLGSLGLSPPAAGGALPPVVSVPGIGDVPVPGASSGVERVPATDSAVAPVGFTTSGTFANFAGGVSYLAPGSDFATLGALIHNGIAQRITNFMRVYDAASGATRPGYPQAMMGLPFLTAPAVADVSGSGQPDVVNNEDTSNVAAFDQSGNAVPGWPKFTGGWTLWTPAVGDLDGNGHNAVADLTREGYLFVWNTPGRATSSEAWNWHQDDWHTGRLGTDTRPPLVPRDLRRSASNRLCWIAPGENWASGSAARYELRAFSKRPIPERFSRGTHLSGVPAPAPAGTRQCATFSTRAAYVGLRAIDHSGLISYPAALRVNAARSGRAGRRGATHRRHVHARFTG